MAAELDVAGIDEMDADACAREIAKVQAELAAITGGGNTPSAAGTAAVPNLVAYEEDLEAMSEEQMIQEEAMLRAQLNLMAADGDVEKVFTSSSSSSSSSSNRKKKESTEKLMCICRQPYNAQLQMIPCSHCQEWYHLVCIGYSPAEANCVEKYVCLRCTSRNHKHKTTYKPNDFCMAELQKEVFGMAFPQLQKEVQRVETELKKLENQALREREEQYDEDEDMEQEYYDAMDTPRPGAKFSKGSRVDAQDSLGNWYPAVVRRVRANAVFVHYYRWNRKYDEWIGVDSGRVAPSGTKCSPSGTKSVSRKKKRKVGASGHKSKGKGKGVPPPAASVTVPKRKKMVNVDQCVICGLGGQLLCCDGCPGSYHGRCFVPPMHVDNLPDEWYCPNCEDDYKRIPVWHPQRSGVLMGHKAPFKKDLQSWLKKHPGYEVWSRKALKF